MAASRPRGARGAASASSGAGSRDPEGTGTGSVRSMTSPSSSSSGAGSTRSSASWSKKPLWTSGSAPASACPLTRNSESMPCRSPRASGVIPAPARRPSACTDARVPSTRPSTPMVTRARTAPVVSRPALRGRATAAPRTPPAATKSSAGAPHGGSPWLRCNRPVRAMVTSAAARARRTPSSGSSVPGSSSSGALRSRRNPNTISAGGTNHRTSPMTAPLAVSTALPAGPAIPP